MEINAPEKKKNPANTEIKTEKSQDKGMTWTEEQRKVIELRGREMLVSAAAGSGKTATLVQRIIERITDAAKPIDIDRLLVVTFTRAAAAEMRERVGRAIEEKLAAQPGNDHLQRQSLLLHSAPITTIDSFCLSVLQNYFHDIDLDPVFRIADEEELTLLRHEAVVEVLEEEYEAEKADFLSFAQCYGGKHQDIKLEDYILRLDRFAASCPWPESWLGEMLSGFSCTSMEESRWMKNLMQTLAQSISGCRKVAEQAVSLCGSDGPYAYRDALESDLECLEELCVCKTYQDISKVLENFQFKALSRKSMPDCPPEKKEQVKALREQIKTCIKGIKEDFFFQDYKEMEQDWRASASPAGALIRLTLRFRELFAEKKLEKRLLDFSDVEHFALNILVERDENGKPCARTAALELRRQYEEIMIDEYQDSNEVQETILRSISREEEGTPNIFMVGDVKQSIYRFRLAKPELFLEKYNTYSKEEGNRQRIDLHKNFRSREEVLSSINELFFKIMGSELGQIEYDAQAALYTGADYLPRKNAAIDNITELLLLCAPSTNLDEEDEEEDSLAETPDDDREFTVKEQEALLLAGKIKELVSGKFTIQKKTGAAPCEYRDIVILLRTMSGWSEVFANVLAAQGVPVVSDTQKGYFNVPEIKWLLNYLRCLDNPLQDIPLVSVLLSPFAGLGTGDLAKVRIECPGRPLYEAILYYSVQGRDGTVREKIGIFLSVFRDLRARSGILTVPELLFELYEKTGYNSFVAAMPAGRQRRDNLAMFAAKAAAFEKSSYRGLFQFIRYVEKLIQYEVDYGEAADASENDNAVRIMSIHRSKGLEFPIVFVSGLTKKFNFSDAREKIIFHPELGLALDYINEEERTTVPTLKKKVLQDILAQELLGEELRLLYVAMTRAKEKLYLTGYVKGAKRQQEKWLARQTKKEEKLYYMTLRQASCYLDFIGPAIGDITQIRTVWYGDSEKQVENNRQTCGRIIDRTQFLEAEPEGFDTLKWQELKKYLQFDYAFEAERQLPVKTSVSELKRRSLEEEYIIPVFRGLDEVVRQEPEEKDTGKTESNLPEEEWQGTLPEFLKTGEVARGADRGTLYHRVLEYLPLTDDIKAAVIKKELAELVKKGRIKPEDRKAISVGKLEKFYQSEIAKRMIAASKRGELYREQVFVLSIPARDLYEIDSSEPVLIQGIIDVFFEEEDGIVLLDYKTDYVPIAPEETLISRYQKQVELYRRAITEITGKKVKEAVIYSFYLQKEIIVE